MYTVYVPIDSELNKIKMEQYRVNKMKTDGFRFQSESAWVWVPHLSLNFNKLWINGEFWSSENKLILIF